MNQKDRKEINDLRLEVENLKMIVAAQSNSFRDFSGNFGKFMSEQTRLMLTFDGIRVVVNQTEAFDNGVKVGYAKGFEDAEEQERDDD